MLCGIYSITNRVNGKMYIGKSRNISARCAQHRSNAKNGNDSCPKLYRAMRKYGEENFIFGIIQLFPNKVPEAILGKAEVEAIAKYNSVINGYNISVGGNGGNLTDENRQKAKEVTKSRYGVDYSLQNVEVQQRARQSLQEHYGVDNPMKCPEIAQRAKISRARNGKTTPVVNVETGKVFISMNEAAKEYGISKTSNIGEVLKGHRQKAGGYHWRKATPEELEAIL